MYVLRFSESVTSLFVSGKYKWNFQYSTRIFFFFLIWWYKIYLYDGSFYTKEQYQHLYLDRVIGKLAYKIFIQLKYIYFYCSLQLCLHTLFYYNTSKYQFNWMSDINPCFLSKRSTRAKQILVSSVNLVVTNKIQYEFVKSTIWMSYLFVWQYNCM